MESTHGAGCGLMICRDGQLTKFEQDRAVQTVFMACVRLVRLCNFCMRGGGDPSRAWLATPAFLGRAYCYIINLVRVFSDAHRVAQSVDTMISWGWMVQATKK